VVTVVHPPIGGTCYQSRPGLSKDKDQRPPVCAYW